MSNNLYKKGSEWRKWDLHFHTPSSYDYKDKTVTNEQIVDILIQNNISAVAITDHHEINIDRINELKGLAKDKITIFPGIEFCSDARGNEPVHFIGIFPEDANLEYVWGEIKSKANIAKQIEEGKKENEIYCELKTTCKLIKKLGGIVTIHAASKSNSIENITNALPSAMAQKRDIAQNIHVFEVGKKDDQKEYNDNVFPSIGTYPIVICSDNHDIKDYILKENCWIKADPTFEGLKQIIYEPDDRVFVGEKPDVFERVKSNKTKYIDSIKINQKAGYGEENGVWFNDINIELNKELVAIIGNKGSGKSAVSDILGLLGNTHNAGENNSNLSFLNNSLKKRKFRKSGFAENFEAVIEWEDGNTIKKSLDDEVDKTQKEKVKYLPQNYFESLTNDLEGEGFEKTLKSVIFLHIPEAKRFGKATFYELEEYKSLSIKKDLSLLKEDINLLSSEIISLEYKKHPDYGKKIDSQLKEKKKELDEHKKNEPPKIEDPSKSKKLSKEKIEKYEKIDGLNKNLEELDKQITQNNLKKSKFVEEKEDLQQIYDDIERFERQVREYRVENKSRFKKHGFDIDKILETNFNKETVKDKIKTKETAISKINILLNTSNEIENEFDEDVEKLKKSSLVVQKEQISEKITDLKKELSKPERKYQEYKEKLKKWKEKQKQIEGDAENPKRTPKTLEFYKAEQNFIINELPPLLIEKRQKRVEDSLKIFKKKKEIIGLYREFKTSIDKEIGKDKKFLEKFKMNIDVSFKLKKGFFYTFLNFINKAKKGSFYGKEDGKKYLNKIFEEKDLLDENDIKNILENIIEYLENDQRDGISGNAKRKNIGDQIDQRDEFYEFVFFLNYLEPNYELKLDDKILDELSPGEKGALLLVFYLMIDKEDIPLIIDQPEDNLDNQSVFKVLTHFIRFAKNRRQIIIVTHNPNMAVGADAEQIVYVNLDKKHKYKFSYESGSIENLKINKHVVDILEGTKPAFDKRKLKYPEIKN